jgi:hypothetical protein
MILRGRVGVKMLYGLFLSLLFGVLLLALWLLLRRHPIWGKRWFRVGSFAFVVLLGIVFLLIPREVRTREYASPEEAFRYKNQGEILLVLEGEQSAYVVAEQGGNSYAYDFIARVGDVWHPVSGIQTKPIVITQGSVVIRIYRYRKTDDYYISITDGKGQDVEIEDNRNSYFYTIGDSYALADGTFSMYTYYAYICDLDETYQLTVNGEAFPVF